MFIDERATDEQMQKLAAVFTGQKGGPMEGVVPLIGEVLGVERASFEVVEEGPQRQDGHEAKRSKISAFGIEYEGKTGISASEFSGAA
jgi:hypothetical protein